jgi:hypothetical protein
VLDSLQPRTASVAADTASSGNLIDIEAKGLTLTNQDDPKAAGSLKAEQPVAHKQLFTDTDTLLFLREPNSGVPNLKRKHETDRKPARRD